MELLLNLIVDDICNSRTDNLLLNLRKKRRAKMKRRAILLKSLSLEQEKPKGKSFLFLETIKSFPEDIFYSQFHIKRPTFNALKIALSSVWSTSSNGRYAISLENCLYITLWKLCNSNVTFRELSEGFQVSKGTAHTLFTKTVRALFMAGFKGSRENSLPFVIGCLDVTHFIIPAPSVDAISYYDHKRKYSVQMQAICDSQFRFLDVFICYAGSCVAADVWRNSPIFNAITSGQLQLAPNGIIVGGCGYPPSKVLMVPYTDHGQLTSEEKKVNAHLCSTREPIEQAVRILKHQFKILNFIDLSSIKAISDVILACVILHNFIIDKGNYSEYIDETPLHIKMEAYNELDTADDYSIWSAEPDDV